VTIVGELYLEIARRSLSKHSILFSFVEIEHSHNTMTVQPSETSFWSFAWSRTLFFQILSFQYASFDFGIRARLQSCPCQKHPRTWTTELYLRKTMSGFPGKCFWWIRNRYPDLWRAERIRSSRRVFLLLTCLIMLERFSDETVSVIAKYSFEKGFQNWTIMK